MKDQMESCNLSVNNNNRIMIYHDITEDHDNSHPSCPKQMIKLWEFECVAFRAAHENKSIHLKAL